jgi:hypothetical protein
MSGTNRKAEKRPTVEDARLRMQARAKLVDPRRPPNFVCVFENSSTVKLCDSHVAIIGDREIVREPGESYEQFEARVRSEIPVNGMPGLAWMVPDAET